MKKGYVPLFIFVLLACSNRNTPQAVSEDFIYNYYQRAEQEAALMLSHGLATEKLEDEIMRLHEVRISGEPIDVNQMPQIKYERTAQENISESEAIFNYKLTIQNSGIATHVRKVVIYTEVIDGKWKVTNFDEY